MFEELLGCLANDFLDELSHGELASPDVGPLRGKVCPRRSASSRSLRGVDIEEAEGVTLEDAEIARRRKRRDQQLKSVKAIIQRQKTSYHLSPMDGSSQRLFNNHTKGPGCQERSPSMSSGQVLPSRGSAVMAASRRFSCRLILQVHPIIIVSHCIPDHGSILA